MISVNLITFLFPADSSFSFSIPDTLPYEPSFLFLSQKILLPQLSTFLGSAQNITSLFPSLKILKSTCTISHTLPATHQLFLIYAIRCINTLKPNQNEGLGYTGVLRNNHSLQPTPSAALLNTSPTKRWVKKEVQQSHEELPPNCFQRMQK